MSDIVLYGASELGRDVASMGPALAAAGTGQTFKGFVDDRAAVQGTEVLGLPVLGTGDWLAREEARDVEVVVTIGDPGIRRRVVDRLVAKGVRFATLIHPSAVKSAWVEIAEGSIVMALCSFTVDVRVGRHVVFNPGCTVAHDVVVGDYVYLSPGVHLAGHVVLEDACYMGTGAVVIPSRRVGARAVIGAGGVVVKDVPPDATAVGVPARVLHKPEPRSRT